MKKRTRKLALKKETLRGITNEELTRPVGGCISVGPCPPMPTTVRRTFGCPRL